MTSGTECSSEVAAALDAAACGLFQLADDGTFRRVNRTFCAWAGRSADELIGRRRLPDLLTMGGRIFYQTHWAPLLRMQGSISEVKLELALADGATVPVVLNAVRHQVAGELVHEVAAFVARDRDRYEQELVRARRRLEDLVGETARLHAEAKDRALFAEQMIGIVSHDLRNPLSTLLMGTALLAGSDLGRGPQRTVTQMTRAIDRANRLIADLLDFTQARIGRGITVEPTTIDLHGTVADALDELRLAYPDRAIVHVRAGATDDGRCRADGDRLVQLIGNLVSNAAAYGAPTAPITVTTSVGPAEVELAVHNGGAPIPAAVQPTLFEAMTRGDTAGSRARGVGLGLFIVREIARAHGGDASLRSSVDDGTTFRVAIPRG